MTALMQIGEVARRTGLSERALRLYEARGLLKPRRSSGGRRLYGAVELERLQQIQALRRGGFSLRQLEQVLVAEAVELRSFLEAQMVVLEQGIEEQRAALAALERAHRRLAEEPSLDCGALCELIQIGEETMSTKSWRRVHEGLYGAEELEQWRAAEAQLPADFDQEEYSLRWAELSQRIEAVLPLDPGSARAASFLAEWNELLEPFLAVATPEMVAGATEVWEQMPEGAALEGDDPPISRAVWEFIKKTQVACS